MNVVDYLDGIAERKLVLQRCANCKRVNMLSALMSSVPVEGPLCPQCYSFEWEPFEATGQATLVSYIVNARSNAEPKPIFAEVLLEEGPRFHTTIVGATVDEIRNDMPLDATFSTDDDGAIVLQFKPHSVSASDHRGGSVK